METRGARLDLRHRWQNSMAIRRNACAGAHRCGEGTRNSAVCAADALVATSASIRVK